MHSLPIVVVSQKCRPLEIEVTVNCRPGVLAMQNVRKSVRAFIVGLEAIFICTCRIIVLNNMNEWNCFNSNVANEITLSMIYI